MLRKTTLLYLLRGGSNGEPRQALLGLKLRGFGKGKWNGIGGKMSEEEDGGVIENTAIRECEEEIHVRIKGPSHLSLRAILQFYYAGKPEWNNQCYVYVATEGSWTGTPADSDEMSPQWFDVPLQQSHFDDMWPDDRYWLANVLNVETEPCQAWRFDFAQDQLADDDKTMTLRNASQLNFSDLLQNNVNNSL